LFLYVVFFVDIFECLTHCATIGSRNKCHSILPAVQCIIQTLEKIPPWTFSWLNNQLVTTATESLMPLLNYTRGEAIRGPIYAYTYVGPIALFLPKIYNPALTGRQMLGLRASLELVKVIMGLPFGACIWVLLEMDECPSDEEHDLDASH